MVRKMFMWRFLCFVPKLQQKCSSYTQYKRYKALVLAAFHIDFHHSYKPPLRTMCTKPYTFKIIFKLNFWKVLNECSIYVFMIGTSTYEFSKIPPTHIDRFIRVWNQCAGEFFGNYEIEASFRGFKNFSCISISRNLLLVSVWFYAFEIRSKNSFLTSHKELLLRCHLKFYLLLILHSSDYVNIRLLTTNDWNLHFRVFSYSEVTVRNVQFFFCYMFWTDLCMWLIQCR